MSKAPAMPMYWDAYLADTTHLTTEEHGAYLLLLAAMWRRNGAVPDNDKDNARILGLTPMKWRKIKVRLMETISGFSVNGGQITQEKLQKTWKNTQEKIEKNRENGAKGGRPKSNENNDIEKPNGSVSVNPNESIPEPEPEPEDTNVSPPIVPQSDFEDFWKIVPRKVGKGAARAAFKKALRKTDAPTLFSAMKDYAKSREGESEQYTVHPATWLNQERWEDEPAARPSDFHDKLDEALKNETDLRNTSFANRSEPERLSAPVSETTPPDGRSGPDPYPQHGGGNQQAIASIIRPRRFGKHGG